MFSHFKNDARAGVVVFLVALPLCLGIALAQGAPLFSGIIAGMIGGIVVSLISGSKLSVSGPAAGLTSIVLASIKELGSFEVFLLAVFLAGIFQVILGLLKAGIIGYYFPSAVVKGMLCAIGLILIKSQFPHFVGFDKGIELDEMDLEDKDGLNFFHFNHFVDSISYGSLLIGLFSLATILLWQSKPVKNNRYLSVIPVSLLVVALAIITDFFFNHYVSVLEVKEEHLVKLPQIGSYSELLSSLTHPDFSAFNKPQVYKVALLLAGVASLETLLSLEAVDKIDPSNNVSPTNRELISQGVGNMVSGLLGGLPVTSVIVRSSVNVSSGARTQLAAFIHGVFLIFAVFIFPGLLGLIPLSALAAILIFTGYNLSHPRIFKSTFKQGLDQFLPFMVTFIGMLATDLLIGVSMGIVVSVIFILKQNYKAPFKMLQEEIDGKMNVFIKFSQNVTFINKGRIIEAFHSIPSNSIVIIDGSRATFIDKDILEIISAFKASARIKNIEVHLEEISEVEVLTYH